MKRSTVLFGLCLLVIGAYVLASPPSGYHLLKKIPFGAAPGTIEYFDYITFDAATRRVYLSHGTEVKVLDADSGSVVGTVSDLKRCTALSCSMTLVAASSRMAMPVRLLFSILRLSRN